MRQQQSHKENIPHGCQRQEASGRPPTVRAIYVPDHRLRQVCKIDTIDTTLIVSNRVVELDFPLQTLVCHFYENLLLVKGGGLWFLVYLRGDPSLLSERRQCLAHVGASRVRRLPQLAASNQASP